MNAVEAVVPSVALRRLVDGFQISQALYAVATLGIADLLANQVLTIEQLAERVHADASALHRVMRALAGVGVFAEAPGRRFSLTSIGHCVCSDTPDPVGGWAYFVGRPYHWQAWSGVLHTVQTG